MKKLANELVTIAQLISGAKKDKVKIKTKTPEEQYQGIRKNPVPPSKVIPSKKDKEKDKQNKEDQNKDQQDKNKQQPKQNQEQQKDFSQEDANRMLEALQNDEKELQKRLKQEKVQRERGKTLKNW
ncbi:MAG: hypothetical protein HC905_30035 [Bacteroidales bacterium]|nr:hypothetical protein [Bacteroidales bacterium]